MVVIYPKEWSYFSYFQLLLFQKNQIAVATSKIGDFIMDQKGFDVPWLGVLTTFL